MPYCSDCGRYADSQALYCKSCGGMMQNAPPKPRPGAAPPPGAIPPAPGQFQQPRPEWGMPQYGPDPYANSEQEAYLSQFSWGSGCGIYFWSRAMVPFFFGMIILNAIAAVFGALAEVENPNLGLALFMIVGGLAIVVASFGLLIHAGKVARRRRWAELTWRSFEQFKQDETTWQVLGIIGWGLQVLGFFVGLAGGIAGTAP